MIHDLYRLLNGPVYHIVISLAPDVWSNNITQYMPYAHYLWRFAWRYVFAYWVINVVGSLFLSQYFVNCELSQN